MTWNGLKIPKFGGKSKKLAGIISPASLAFRIYERRGPQLLPRCMEVHCLQCKNCQYRYLWQYPSEMSNFFSWPLFTRLDDYQNNSSLSDHLISLVLIPGGFYYWRDACSTMVHHCQRADFKESSKLLRVTNCNGASQPYETFCTLTRHPNTPLGPKNPKNPTQEPPQKRFSFRKCDERGWKSTLSTLPRKRKS